MSDPRSLGSRCIKDTDESVTRVDLTTRSYISDPDPDYSKGACLKSVNDRFKFFKLLLNF